MCEFLLTFVSVIVNLREIFALRESHERSGAVIFEQSRLMIRSIYVGAGFCGRTLIVSWGEILSVLHA